MAVPPEGGIIEAASGGKIRAANLSTSDVSGSLFAIDSGAGKQGAAVYTDAKTASLIADSPKSKLFGLEEAGEVTWPSEADFAALKQVRLAFSESLEALL